MSEATAQANIEVVKGMLAGAGQEEAMQRLLSDHVVLTVPQGLPYGGEYPGLDGYRAIIGGLMGFWSEFHLDPPEFATAGDKVVVISRLTGKLAGSGREIDQPFCEIWKVQDGKVMTVTPFYYDTKTIADG